MNVNSSYSKYISFSLFIKVFAFNSGSRHHIHPQGRRDNMIFDIPYDYTHLMCLGACKRLLSQVWVGKEAKRPHRFSTAHKRKFNDGIFSFAKTLTSKFKRKALESSRIS